MALSAGMRLGPYEIVSTLGAGGMGEVYRARDTRLKRDVALKVIPESFAADPERLARFQREAEVLAALNHPYIAAIHGLEESDGTRALIMELVEGETLAQRIARGPIPADEALPIARQIAEALEAANEKGVIHRDLKPANIKITPKGDVKVLDFGLAKLTDVGRVLPSGPAGSTGQGPAPVQSQLPTITSPALMTGAGVLLGTAAYMAPEQAKGRPADKRCDIWAFGCVLYEMLTGKRPFEGEDVTDVLVAVLGREPANLDALPADVPAGIRALLRRCLEKDRRKRVADISTALFAIDEAEAIDTAGRVQRSERDAGRRGPAGDAGSAGPMRADADYVRKGWRRIATFGVPPLITAAIAAGGVWLATRPAPPRVSRLAITTTPATALTIDGGERHLAITPDGTRVIYVGNNGTELFVRPINVLEAVSLFKGAPRGPFMSPDSKWIGFIDGATALKKIAITGGPAVTITSTLDGNSRGATWLPDNTIVFATGNTTTGLQQVPSAGGPITVLTRPGRGEVDHLWPEMLPGGRAVLFTIIPVTGSVDAEQIAVFDRQSGTHKVVMEGGSHAYYVSSGHLIYAADNTLRAVPFDPATLEVRGPPVAVVSEVVTTTGNVRGGVDAAVSADNTLAYVRGGADAAQRALVWVNRQGQETPVAAPPHRYLYPRISPDGERIVTWSNDQDIDLWMWDLVRLTLRRLTFDRGADEYPVWTPDGRRLLFASDREGARNLFWQAADGTGSVERLTRSPNQQSSSSVSPDGTQLIFTEASQTTSDDVMQAELSGSHKIVPLVQSQFAERNGIVSPDGRWLAYEANDSGQLEIYVRPYPNVRSGHWQVSTGGGTRPLWSPNGQELFYVSPTGAIMRVGVERGASWAATTPATVIKEGYATVPAGINPGRTYDVSSDGKRFLLLKGADEPNSPQSQIVVVQHFDEELRRLVPVK